MEIFDLPLSFALKCKRHHFHHFSLFILVRGKLFLIVGPSGVGKGSAITGLKKRHPEFLFPLSATTRAKRSGEEEGDVYHFWSKAQFKAAIDNGEFLEWAIVHQDNYYGTLKKPILEGIENGKVVIRELDIQGFESVLKKMDKADVVSIFLVPKKMEDLKTHIFARGKMSDDELKKRMKSADDELAKASECDYRILSVHGEIEGLINDIEEIIMREMD